MKKTVVITAMVGLMLWFPMMAEAKKDKHKKHEYHKYHKHHYESLKKQIADLQKKVADIQLKPGPVGPKGPAGPRGPEGPAGSGGVDDELSAELDSLDQRLEAIEDYISRSTGFTDLGDGTVRDNSTGLIWLENPITGVTTSAGATASASDLVAAGHDDWRLPTQAEFDAFLCWGARGGNKFVCSPQFIPSDNDPGYWTYTPGNEWGDSPYYLPYDNSENYYVSPADGAEYLVWPVR